MAARTLVYWHGVIGVAGKGPNYSELYDPNRTIGELIETMKKYNLGENGKRIEIFKFQRGNLSKFDKNDPYWSHDTKLSEYLNIMGVAVHPNHLMLVYHIV